MENQTSYQEPINNDTPSLGYQILAFIVPIVGVIMYFNKLSFFTD